MGTLGWLVIGGVVFLVLFAWLFGTRPARDLGEAPPSSATRFRPPRSSDRSVRLKQLADKPRREASKHG